MKNVKLEELEFIKLIRYNEQLERLTLKGEAFMRELQDNFNKIRNQRDSYFVELCGKYEDLQQDRFYVPNEETLELCPQEQAANA